MAQWLTNPTSIHEDLSLILASLSGSRIQHCCEPWCRSQTQLVFALLWAVVQAGISSSDLTPTLGTSMCQGCSHKKIKKKKKKRTIEPSFYYFFAHAHTMQKFLGQGSNPHHSSNWSHCSGNTRSLTCCAARELPEPFFLEVHTRGPLRNWEVRGNSVNNGSCKREDRGKGNRWKAVVPFFTWLVGLFNGAATVENSLVVPQNVKRRIPMSPSSSSPRYVAKRIENGDSNRCLYIMLTAALPQ